MFSRCFWKHTTDWQQVDHHIHSGMPAASSPRRTMVHPNALRKQHLRYGLIQNAVVATTILTGASVVKRAFSNVSSQNLKLTPEISTADTGGMPICLGAQQILISRVIWHFWLRLVCIPPPKRPAGSNRQYTPRKGNRLSALLPGKFSITLWRRAGRAIIHLGNTCICNSILATWR